MIEDIQQLLEDSLDALMRVRRLVNTAKFRLVYSNASMEEKDHLKSLLHNPDAFAATVERLNSKELDNSGIRELRELASQLGVFQYSKLTKALLLSEIKRLRNARRSHSNGSYAPQRDAISDN